MSTKDSSSPVVEAEVVETIPGDIDMYRTPEQFAFCVELWQEAPITTICPIEYFETNGYLDDAYYAEISEFLEKNNFFPVLEAAYEFDDEKASVETVTAKMLELGFKQLPAFDKYMEETTTDFSVSTLNGVGDESESTIEAVEEMNEETVENDPTGE